MHVFLVWLMIKQCKSLFSTKCVMELFSNVKPHPNKVKHLVYLYFINTEIVFTVICCCIDVIKYCKVKRYLYNFLLEVDKQVKYMINVNYNWFQHVQLVLYFSGLFPHSFWCPVGFCYPLLVCPIVSTCAFVERNSTCP